MAKIQEWMIIHKWMTDYTPQTEWIERRGILVWIAEVCTSVGTGLFLGLGKIVIGVIVDDQVEYKKGLQLLIFTLIL